MSTPSQAWLKPVAQTLPDQVAQMILARIAVGELPEGEKLPSQRNLARSLGVGLAVVREAVQRLAALNVVEATHGSGTVVRAVRWGALIYDQSLFMLAVERIGVHDLWETRRLLEAQIVRLAVERAGREDLDAMAAILAEADPLPVEYAVSQALNRRFHLALARSAKNLVLEDLVSPLIDVRFAGVDHLFTPGKARTTWDAHRAIFEAVAARDVAAADHAIVRHFTIGPIAMKEIKARQRSLRASIGTRPPTTQRRQRVPRRRPVVTD